MTINRRLHLAEFIDNRIGELGGGLHDFTEKLSQDMGRPYEVYRKFVYAVRVGRKAIPEGKAEEAWAKRLRLNPAAMESFRELVQAARAHGKSNGREHLTRLEERIAQADSENARLRAEADDLRQTIVQQEVQITQLEALLAKRR